MATRVKYPRTPHLPWSPGMGGDDILLDSLQALEKLSDVVVTKTSFACRGTTPSRGAKIWRWNPRRFYIAVRGMNRKSVRVGETYHIMETNRKVMSCATLPLFALLILKAMWQNM